MVTEPVSTPKALTTTVQQPVDLLAELSELLAADHGPVPEEYLAEARAAWPDSE